MDRLIQDRFNDNRATKGCRSNSVKYSRMYHMVITVTVIALSMTVFATTTRALAQQISGGNEPDSANKATLARINGLRAQYTTEKQTITRIDPDLQFVGNRDDEDSNWALDSRLPSNPFQANWKGSINVNEGGRFKFFFFGLGKFILRVEGKELLRVQSDHRIWKESAEIDLLTGAVPIEVEYESKKDAASLGLYWSSNLFQLEPIETHLLTCQPSDTSDLHETNGRMLSRALRCQSCHFFANKDTPLPAPSLVRVKDNLKAEWIVSHLMEKPAADEAQPLDSRRMPYFEFTEAEALAISAALLKASESSKPPQSWSAELQIQEKERKPKDPPVRTQADANLGQQTFASQGCIACHTVGSLGKVVGEAPISKLFAGSDLTKLSSKRSSDAIARWLDNPASVNPHHRMPRFELTPHQKLDLHAFLLQDHETDSDTLDRRVASDLKEQGSGGPNPQRKSKSLDEQQREAYQIAQGQLLIRQSRCGACHELPASLPQGTGERTYERPTRIVVHEKAAWTQFCLGSQTSKQYPNFRLSSDHIAAIKNYLTRKPLNSGGDHPQQILAEHNCLSCHRRGTESGIFKHFIDLAENYPELATKLAGMTPPALNGVGDKLHRQAIVQALGAHPERLREWLDIRMPQFDLKPNEIDRLADFFISHDRIPNRTPDGLHGRAPVKEAENATEKESTSNQAYWLAAGRLVTPDGFSCLSCHQIAEIKPAGIALNAHGTNLTMVGRRIREPWFYRWVKNPARIVPRMEMPAIQQPVHGVLDGTLDSQLTALWRTLNRPDFRPPKPNPVRIVRNYNDGESEPTHVLTDVMETPEVVVRPLVFGLPNRHNWMIDLATGNLRHWWIGDVARQHTRGKSWYWEPGAQPLLRSKEPFLESWSIVDTSGRALIPQALRGQQFAMQLDTLRHTDSGVLWSGRLHFGSSDSSNGQTLQIRQTWSTKDDRRCITNFEVEGLREGQTLFLQTPSKSIIIQDEANQACRVTFEGGHYFEYQGELLTPSSDQGRIAIKTNSDSAMIRWSRTMGSALAADKFNRLPVAKEPLQPKALDGVPGFLVTQLPLPRSEMPIAFAWDRTGRGYVGSLKGRVLELLDENSDGFEDSYKLVSDELPTPYGLYAGDEGLDVLAKFGLLRLAPAQSGGPIMDATVIADGWGYTPDYHDWAVGLKRDAAGNYYMTLPCQQDDRSPEAAHLRGHALRLVPESKQDGVRKYWVESIAAGLRFPMGLALSREGDLFTSDNQGNYTPFNELNHIREGKRYGFINKLENKNGFSPPFESPAINIPHPWMRSVNGICFLDTPESYRQTRGDEKLFGPFEGHLLGCEMNGRCLVRMSLQKVNGQFQGAVYPFSFANGRGVSNLEGPIVCEVAPGGDIYVGNLHDSGWGGGNNTGSIVRISPTGQWPLGIAEVQAQPGGLDVVLTGEVDSALANDKKNYSIRSYIRTPTPAYGGEDQKEQIEQIESVAYDASNNRIRIRLGELREGAVYEINVGNIGPNGVSIFPNQAHYTMRSVPQP